MRGLPYTYKCSKCENRVAVISDKYPPVCANKHESIKMELQDVRPKTNN